MLFSCSNLDEEKNEKRNFNNNVKSDYKTEKKKQKGRTYDKKKRVADTSKDKTNLEKI